MNKTTTFPALWSILPDNLNRIKQSYADYMNGKGDKVRLATLADPRAVDNPSLDFIPAVFYMEGSSAVMVISGVITAKSDFFSFLFGGTGLDVLKRDFNTLVNDESVTDIFLDIDSPGGTVFAVQEFANMVFEARSKKRIIATSRSMMASAAYWVGAAAGEVFIADNQVVTGSIGVVATHIDVSELERMIGIKSTEIVAGRFKRISSSLKPLSEEGREDLQRQVDHVYGSFVDDVARFRGVSADDVLSNMADGKTFVGNEGIQAGLIDGMFSLDDLIEVEDNPGSDNPSGTNINLFKGDDMGAKTMILAENLSAEMLKADYPGVYNAIFNAGKAEAVETSNKDAVDQFAKGKEQGQGEGEVVGATQERERILAVEAKSIPGHEKLISKMVADGTTTGPEAAEAVLGAEQKLRDLELTTLAKEAILPVGEEVRTKPAAAAKEGDANAGATAQELWDGSKDLQAEFGTFGVFEAYHKNEQSGNIKVLSTK